MSGGLAEADLPGFWSDADTASLAGQKWSLRYSKARLFGVLLAAFGGALTWMLDKVDMAAVVIGVGFLIALASELATWVHQPDRDWYSGRALAESAKTLAWRFAVRADPFPEDMPEAEARVILRQRLDEVSAEARDRVTIGSLDPIVTPAMIELRRSPFQVRKTAYIEDRTEEQQKWYARKAKSNAKAATGWRIVLVVSEVVALVLAALRVTGGWTIDFAGLFSAFIAAGAAWMALKQHSPLASAYSTAATELAIQADRISDLSQQEWATAIADAEEAISREHTLWLASRTGKRPVTS
jgi:hypothetical protein